MEFEDSLERSDNRDNMSTMMSLCFGVQEALKFYLMQEVLDFAFKRGFTERAITIGQSYDLNEVVTSIQKGLESKDLIISRRWTTEELFNLTIMGISTWKAGEDSYQFIYHFWTKYFDCYMRVCDSFGNLKLKTKLQTKKKKMLLKFGAPPFVADSTFHYVHMTYPPTKGELMVVSLPESLPKDVTIVKKSDVNIIVLGHDDSGKSTVTFDLICKWSCVDKKTLEKFENDAEEMQAFKHAVKFIVRNGVDAADITLYKFETQNCCVKIAHPFSHTDFIENSNTLSQVDCAVLIVSAGVDEFEAGNLQIVQQARVAYERGIKRLIVVVNKMDVTHEPPYSEARYAEIKRILSHQIKKIGFNLDLVPFVPISGWLGENVFDGSPNLLWYEGFNIEREGVAFKAKTLVETLDTIMPTASLSSKDDSLHFHDVVPDVGWKTSSPVKRSRQYDPIYTKDVAVCGKIMHF